MHIEVYIELIMMHTGVKKKQLTHGGWLHYTTLVSLHIPANVTFLERTCCLLKTPTTRALYKPAAMLMHNTTLGSGLDLWCPYNYKGKSQFLPNSPKLFWTKEGWRCTYGSLMNTPSLSLVYFTNKYKPSVQGHSSRTFNLRKYVLLDLLLAPQIEAALY